MASILNQMSDVIGGDVAVSEVPENYSGCCAVVDRNDKQITIMPTVNDAIRAACYAITPDGGYCGVRVLPAPGATPTHADFYDWAF